jgi:hypothetical protein
LALALDSGENGVDGFDPDGSGLSLASATKRLMSICSPTIELTTAAPEPLPGEFAKATFDRVGRRTRSLREVEGRAGQTRIGL